MNAIIASYLPPSSTLAVSGPAGQVGARVSTIMKSDNTNLTYEKVRTFIDFLAAALDTGERQDRAP